MALLWFEGFEMQPTDTTDYKKKYADGQFTQGVNTGRWTGNAKQFFAGSSDFLKTPNLGNRATAFIGAHLHGLSILSSTTNGWSKWLSIGDIDNEQIRLEMSVTNGKAFFRIVQGSTVIGTTLNGVQLYQAGISSGPWMWVEWKVILDTNGSDGHTELRINGTSVLLFDNIQTRGYSSLIWNTFKIFDPTTISGGAYDNVHVLDSTGSAPLNTWLGETSIIGWTTTGAGAKTQWTDTGPSTGQAHWSQIDNFNYDDDTSYIKQLNSVDGNIDLFTHTQLPTDGSTIRDTLYAIAYINSLRMDTSGTMYFQPWFRNATPTESAGGTEQGITTFASYTDFLDMAIAANPVTSAAWTISDWNAMQIGAKAKQNP